MLKPLAYLLLLVVFLAFGFKVQAQTSIAANTTTACLNASQPEITFTYTGGTGPYTFTYTINNGSDQTAVTSSGNSVIVPAPTTVAGTFVYKLIRGVDANGITIPGGSASVTITVEESPSITTQPQSIAKAAGCDASFSVVAGGTGPFTYQWQKNGNNIAGATTDTYTINPVSANDADNYKVIVSNGCGSITSNAATLTVNPPLTAGSHNTDAITGCSNYNPPPLTVSGTTGGSGAGTYLYQWQLSTDGGTWTNITDSTSSSINPQNLVTPGVYSYRVAITDACGQTVFTTPKTITIVADPTVTITGVTNVCQGDALTLGTTVSGGTGLYDFRWESSPDGVNNWTTAFTDANKSTSNYVVPTSTAGTIYYRVILEPNVVSCNNSSAVVSLIVNALPTITGPVTICQGLTTTLSGSGSPALTDPWTSSNTSVATVSSTGVVTGVAAGTATITYTNNNGCQQMVTITVNALPTAFSVTGGGSYCVGGVGLPVGLSDSQPGVSYQLQKDGVDVGSVVAGTGSAISFGNQTAAGVYTVIATNTTTTCSLPMTGSVTISINPLPTASAGSNSPVCAASTLNLTANGGTSYSWTGPSGFNSTQQNPVRNNVTAGAGGTYTVTVTDANGCTSNATTEVTIIPTVAPSVFISADPGNSICQGTAVTFTATPTNGGANPSYQWQVNGVNVGTNSPTYSSSSFVNGDKVTVTMTSNATCPLPATVTSSIVTMTVNDLVTPSVSIAPSANNICPGTPVTFTTTTINGGPSPTYQWQVNGTPAGTSSPSFSSSTLNNNDVVSVIVTSNAACASPTTASSSVTMTVKPVPVPAVSIASSTNNICPGTSVTFTATPTNGGTTPTYQWQVNGTNAGTNNATFTSTTLNNNDIVTVILTSNAACASPTTASSTGITMVVNPAKPAKPGAITGNAAVCPGITGITYSIAGVPNATNYTWTVPSGWTITNGQGTTTITVTSGSSGQNGNVTVTASNSCGTSAANTLPVTVNSGIPATPGIISGSNEQCINKTGLSYSITAVPNATSYTWTVPAGWTITSGQGSTNITVSTSGTAVSGNITVSASNICGTSASSSFAVIASTGTPSTPQIPSAPANQASSICPVASGLIYSVPPVAGATGYTWNLPTGWTITSGQGTNSIVVTVGVQAVGTKNISVTATNACGSATSGNLTVNVNTFAFVDAGPDQEICVGTNTVSLQATGGGATNINNDLTWSAPSGSFSNATKPNPTYTIPASITNGGSITVTVTARGEGSCPSISDQMVVLVRPNPTASISGSTTICSGSSSNIIFTATPNTTLTYKIGSGSNQTIAIDGSGTATLSTGNLTASITYNLVSVAYTTAPGCSQNITGSASITVNQVPTVNAGGPDVTCQSATPTAITLSGASMTGVSNAAWSITSGGGTLSNTAMTTNPATVTYTPAANFSGTVTLTLTTEDPAGPCGPVSSIRTITVNAAPTINAGGPDVTCQSATPTAITLSGASMTGVSNAAWSITSGGGTLSNTAMTTNPATVTYTPAANFSGTVTLTLTTEDPAGPCGPVSSIRTITVNAAPTVDAGPAQTICSNGTATMAATIGGSASSGTWSTTGSGSFSNNTPTAVYTPSAADINTGSVTLTYTTDDPAGPCGSVNSTVSITIKKAVVITTQPSNTSVCAGLHADLTVQAVGDGLTYQWFKGTAPGGTAVSNSSNISGAQSATLHFNQAALTDDGNYYVVISGAAPCAPVTSAQRTLNVDQAINITTQPVSQTLCAGSNVSFNVVADANGDPLSYQWRKNGTNISGQTSATLTLNNISSTDAGTYDVVITGPAGYTCSSTISAPATLTVNNHSTITLSSASGTNTQTKCINNAITPITYTIGGGGTGASVASGGLPAGVTGVYSNGVFSISGTPTAAGAFSYTVTTTGPCNNVTATGTITINDNSTLVLTSNNATQPVCANGSITPITYNVGGAATGVNVTGLPGGVSGTLNNDVFTISGNPTAPGSYPFSVTTTGPCINPTLNGTITVNPNSTLTLTSSSADQRLCVNSVPTNITYAIGGGATGATVTGLPDGMIGTYSAGTLTITNTPTKAGTYNYTVTTTGNCNNKSLNGTIIVDPVPAGGTTSPAITTVCGTTNSGTISLTGQSGTIIRWESSTNGGGTWTPITNTTNSLTYSNLPQTTIFRAVIQSGVCPLAYSTNAVVSMVPATTPTATVSPTQVCLGQSANLGAKSGLPQTWADIDATFNQANPAGWRVTYNGVEINFPANADNATTFPWSETNGPKTPFNGGVTYNNLQTDGKFAIASGIVNTTMETPVFSTIGMTSATLQFYQALVFAAGASGKIEISTDGGATYNTTLKQYNGPLTIGNPASSWDPLSLDLSSYLGLSNLRIRFTYTGADNSNWAIDGLKLQPPGPTLTYNWTLIDPSGVSSPYYLSATNRDTVTATPPAPGTYTYQVATTIGGCPGGTANVVVTVMALPVITPVNSCVGGGTVTFTQTGGASGGTWSVSGGGTVNASTGVFTPSSAGCFTVTYKTPGPGCTDTKSFVVFPAAPVLSVPANTCNTAFTLPSVTAVNGFSVQYSINNGTWAASPAIPTTPGCYSIQARYVLATACGTNAVGTVSPGCLSNTVNVVIFPTAPAPVVNSGCGPIIVTPPASVAGFNIQYSFDDGATWGTNTPPTADNCTGYKIKVRYVTSAACGAIAAGTAAPAGCESPSVTRKVDNTKPTVTCPTVQPVCEVPGKTYTIPPLIASDNCSANSALSITYSITGATTRSGTGVDASGIFNVGVSTITWTVVDECGNSNTCSTQVTTNPKPTPTIYHN